MSLIRQLHQPLLLDHWWEHSSSFLLAESIRNLFRRLWAGSAAKEAHDSFFSFAEPHPEVATSLRPRKCKQSFLMRLNKRTLHEQQSANLLAAMHAYRWRWSIQ